ncbi:MAG: DUF4440 domain-containing protein [Bacteroidetes bacterium]|nr:DUF4440 domain-containing protein [Bacteroidota bacterium]
MHLYLVILLLPAFAIGAEAQSTDTYEGSSEDITAILAQSRALSEAYMAGDIEALVAVYAEDGIAAPGGRDFIRGHDALFELWSLPEGRVVTHHQAIPEELRVEGDMAYDWGYYEGAVTQDGEARPPFRGKYLVVWQRDPDGVWRIAHDMWNSLPAED